MNAKRDIRVLTRIGSGLFDLDLGEAELSLPLAGHIGITDILVLEMAEGETVQTMRLLGIQQIALQ